MALFYYLPETKGLTLQEIEEYYNDLRVTLASQQRVMSKQKEGSGSIRESTKKIVIYLPTVTEKESSTDNMANVTENKTSTTTSKGKE